MLGAEDAPSDVLVATATGLVADGLGVVVTGTDAAVLAQVRDRLATELPAAPVPQVADPGLRWLPLPVHGDPPVTEDELLRLVRLHARDTPEHRRRRRQAFPAEEFVPSEEQVRVLADRVTRADLAARHLDPGLRDILDRPDAGEVLAVIREVKARLGDVLEHRRAWVVKVADLALADPHGADWRRVWGQTDAIERLIAVATELDDTVVEGVEPSAETLQAFTSLQAELASGQPARRWFRGKAQRTAARLLESARVDGEPVTDAAGAAAVLRFLEIADRTAGLEEVLAPLGVPVPPVTPRDELVDDLTDVLAALGSVDRLVVIARRLIEVLGPGRGDLPVGSVEDAERVQWAGEALAAVREGELARRELESAARRLEQAAADVMRHDDLDQPAPEVAELVLCLRAAADMAYSEWLVKMHLGRRARRLAVLREELVARVAERAPGLPALLEADSAEAIWTPRIARWTQAWEAARAASEAMTAPPAAVVGLPELLAGAAAGGTPDVVVVHDPAGAHVEDLAVLRLAPRTIVLTAPAGPREVVLALAVRGPVSGADVRTATGLNADKARVLLKQLVDEGELVRTGATSAARWHLPEHDR